ncbi:cytochrome P450 705A12-like isoform X2 [Mangifera indica]|uniref:cytochrome P450 705A12-like isoform X1 n=1 Tax=Mangifera indica TaxID=29780 RepID=UPI001CFAA1FD|nr:cytochrome P450 705A12-like isoform X1 [Mangifera indica]XP_044512103.1 cytochrome P450 705A12-like isoform X2 [Mangifera indica]
MVELINHPEMFSKVKEEIESIVGRSRLVEESGVPNLPYLRAAVKESLRLHPPTPVLVWEVYENCNIKGFDITERTITVINLCAIMRDPDLWEKPQEFQPERFLVCSKEQKSNNPDEETKKQLINYLSFGGGKVRSCPSSLLALALMNTAIATMVQCFDFEEAGSGVSITTLSQQLQCRPVVHFNPFH